MDNLNSGSLSNQNPNQPIPLDDDLDKPIPLGDDLDKPIPLGDDLDKPIPLGDDLDKPIPFDGAGAPKASVSHSPLNLGGGPAATPRIEIPKPVAKKTGPKIVSSDQITGVKNFFTKLHPGALEFLDGHINEWLKKNPGVVIKRTNVTTGNVQAKKTEPNIIITVWY